jgi:hypothetical protein
MPSVSRRRAMSKTAEATNARRVAAISAGVQRRCTVFLGG